MLKYQDPHVPFVPDRTKLPIHEPVYEPITAKYLKDAPPPPPRFTVAPPEGAPNVLVILLDDMGFGATSPFGGPIPMPTAERLSKRGMRFNHFHTTSICAPTRTALLSGYNHHSCNMGNITELGTSYPGNLSVRPKDVTPLARVMRDNGYSTAQFGKCHETPTWETSISGPFDHWPTFSGFDKFYGFVGAEANQYTPNLVDGLAALPTPTDPNYHLSEDLAQKCTEWIRFQKALTPDKPFFTYFAPGATHGPHHVTKEYIDMFKGQFDKGWDAVRMETYENMKQMGIIPPNAPLAPKPEDIKDWDTLSPKEKEVHARLMEVYAGFAHHVDVQIGKVIDTLEELNILDDTLVFYILGDNGASSEGSLNGSFNEMISINGHQQDIDFLYKHMDDFGTNFAYNMYAVGWAIAMNAPFTWCKTIASDFGGTRNGMIISYPAKYKAGGEMRTQFAHVIDVAPTVLELCNIPAPTEVDGVLQRPMEGTSMAYALADPKAAERHKTQYFRVLGNYGIYDDNWFAGVVGSVPWRDEAGIVPDDEGVWALYDLSKDYSMCHDLAAEMPEKLKEMQDLFFAEAVKYNVLPLDGRVKVLFNARDAGRPTLMGDRKEVTLGQGMAGIQEGCFLNTKNVSFTITAEVEVGNGHTDGVIFAHGGRTGGYSLYVKDGLPVFCYNFLGLERYFIRSTKPLSDERNQIVADFQYDGGGRGKGATVTIRVNNKKVAEGRVAQTIPNTIGEETADVGMDRGTPVCEEYPLGDNQFAGNIYAVTIKVSGD